MTPEKQRIAIAKACGWTAFKEEIHPAITYLWAFPPEDEGSFDIVPDYLTDLNAIHEAEKVLDDAKWFEYMLNLMDVCQRHFDLGKWTCVQVCMSATAAQRAEAFLRTLNLWEE